MSDDAVPVRATALAETIKDFRAELRVEVKLTRIRLERVERAIARNIAAVENTQVRLSLLQTAATMTPAVKSQGDET